MPASLRSDGVRVHPGMPFGFLSEWAFSFVGIPRLHALVRDHLQMDAFAGHLYLFTNKRRDRVKILYWDRDGFAIWSKRLEEGSYVIPAGSGSEARYEITAEELGALLSGIDLQSAKRRKRYQRANR